jgi:hypothetical protein
MTELAPSPRLRIKLKLVHDFPNTHPIDFTLSVVELGGRGKRFGFDFFEYQVIDRPHVALL